MLMIVTIALSQDAIRYQGIAFDSNNEIVQDSDIAIRMSILEGGPTGAVIYSERHELITSSVGSFELSIGKGIELGDSFSDIDWAQGNMFLEVSVDVAGGTDYLLAGTTEFLSVPYAQYGLTAEHGPIGDQGPMGNPGAVGPPGSPGLPGFDGIGGFPGPQGPTGPIGPQGPQGQQGPPGVDAAPGGADGPAGPPGPFGPQGINGGSEGPIGPTGIAGPAGPMGPAGIPGPIGPVGGTEGPEGPQGPQGPPGDPNGPMGDQGDQGPRGPDSPPGVMGPQGPKGPAGIGIQEMKSTPPPAPLLHDIYLDNGDNRDDVLPGFRYFDGTTWIDLY